MSSGSRALNSRTSPDSQCLPTMRAAHRAVGVDGARQERLVAAAVEHRPGVVAHAAVDGDVRAHTGDRLDRADRVDRDGGSGDDGPAGLDADRRADAERAAQASSTTFAHSLIVGASSPST